MLGSLDGTLAGVSDGPCAVSAEMGLDVDEPGYAHVGPHSEPASARAGFHALLRTGSMHAAASQAMSAEEFYDHLADTGWLTFLNAPHVFEAGDDMPADILMGTEIEAARLELLSNEIRYTVRHVHGDVVVQVEVKNFLGYWTAILGAASYNNDEVRLLPNIASATGDALCLRARLEPGAARQQLDAGKGPEGSNSGAGLAAPTPERAGGIFVWQETELTVELNHAAACLGICQLQRYICGASCIADTVRHYSFVDPQIARPKPVAPAAPALPSPDMAWLRFGGCAGTQPPADHCKWSAVSKALLRLRPYMRSSWLRYLAIPTVLAPTDDCTAGDSARVPSAMLPPWLGAEGDVQQLRRYRLEDVSNDMMLVVEECVQVPWEGQLGEASDKDKDASEKRWEVQARLSFALGQWRIVSNVFSRTGDALVLRTPVKRDNRLAATVSKMASERSQHCAPSHEKETGAGPLSTGPRPEPEPEPEPNTVPAWIARVPTDPAAAVDIDIDTSGGELDERAAARRVLQSSGFEAGAWLTELRTVSSLSTLSRSISAVSISNAPRCQEIGIVAGGVEVDAEVELTVNLYTQGLMERWRCPPAARAQPLDQRATVVRRPSGGKRRSSVDETALASASSGYSRSLSSALQGISMVPLPSTASSSVANRWRRRRGSVDSSPVARLPNSTGQRVSTLGGGTLSASTGTWGGTTATLQTVRDRRWVTELHKLQQLSGQQVLMNNDGERPPIAVAGGLGAGGAMRRRAAASSLLQHLSRPHRFFDGDEVSELVCGGASGAKMIALGMTLGLAVPIPGFALIGGLAGAMLAAPSVQLLVVRYVRNHSLQRLRMVSPNGSEDLRLTVDLASKKHSAFVQSAVYSLEAGDWSLSGSSAGERLTLRQRVELTNHCIGIVEDVFSVEPVVDSDVDLAAALDSSGSAVTPKLQAEDVAATRASLGEYGTESEAVSAASIARRGSKPRQQRDQLVCTQNIMVGSALLSTTRRTYRFETDGEYDDAGRSNVGALTRDSANGAQHGQRQTHSPPSPPPPSP